MFWEEFLVELSRHVPTCSPESVWCVRLDPVDSAALVDIVAEGLVPFDPPGRFEAADIGTGVALRALW